MARARRLGGGAGFIDIGFAKLDTGRLERRGMPEGILCEGKSPAQVAEIFRVLSSAGHVVIGTRASGAQAKAVGRKAGRKKLRFNKLSGTLVLGRARERGGKKVLLMSAGTADLPVLIEAKETLEDGFGIATETVADVGVAGLHRLLASEGKLKDVRFAAVIVAAGMDGALPSVVAGMTGKPVIGLPTSVGYGASFGGLAALLAMLNSCAGGLAVVNIDNGFGAACLAAAIVGQAPEP